jgi:hypothetical protein
LFSRLGAHLVDGHFPHAIMPDPNLPIIAFSLFQNGHDIYDLAINRALAAK